MIDKFNIQKLRELDILQVADLLGMGLRNKRALCIHHDDHRLQCKEEHLPLL